MCRLTFVVAMAAFLWTSSGVWASGTTPPASGVLFDASNEVSVASIKTQNTTVSVIDAGGVKTLKVESSAVSGYPDFDFPTPDGGWNLSGFGGVRVDVLNAGQKDAIVGLHAADWTHGPWSTEFVKLTPGQTQTIDVTFGYSYHAIGSPLDAAHITLLKLYVSHPTGSTALLVKNLRTLTKSAAFVPAAAPPGGPPPVDPNAISLPGFTKGADRDRLVKPAAWVGSHPPVDGDWVQTFNDNFDGAALNSNYWSASANYHIPGQLQTYTMDNVLVGTGGLKIVCEKRSGPTTANDGTYTSGAIESYGKWTQLYGYFEARIKLPNARGLWPAFWMMPDRGVSAGTNHVRKDTANGGMEIDIMEQLAEWGAGRYSIATHWDGYGEDHKKWGNKSTYYGPTEDGWHNWGVLWEPGKLTWYCDGIEKAEWVNDRVGAVPEYLILNVQIGGWATSNVDDASLPQSMQVAYVRVWQLKNRITAKP